MTLRPLRSRLDRMSGPAEPIARYVCGADGCDSAPALVTVKLDFAAGTYARCDAIGCDTYVIDVPYLGFGVRLDEQRSRLGEKLLYAISMA